MSVSEKETLLYSIHYRQLVNEFKSGIEIKNRKYKLKTYKSCFIGEEAVTWLVEHGFAENRKEAVTLGNLMLENGVFTHVTNAHTFGDKYLFYKFTYEEAEKKNKFLFMMEYRLEQVIELVQNLYFVATVRRVNTTSPIFLLQYFEKVFCDSSDRRMLSHMLYVAQKNIHPNIVAIRNWEISKRRCLFIYSATPGLSLLAGLARFYSKDRNPVNLYQKIRSVTRQIVEGLLHLHQHGIAYGILSSCNVLFEDDSFECDTVQITEIGTSLASQYYKGVHVKYQSSVSPESYSGSKTNSFKSLEPFQLDSIKPKRYMPSDDAWSLGIILYSLLYGEYPYPLWDLRDFHDLIENGVNPCRFQMCVNDGKHLGTKTAADLLQKLLKRDPNERLKLSEVLEHPFFTESIESITSLPKDWSHAGCNIVQRWTILDYGVQQEYCISKSNQNQNDIVPNWNKKKFRWMSHILLPIKTYHFDKSKQFNTIVVNGDASEDFMACIAAENLTSSRPIHRETIVNNLKEMFSSGKNNIEQSRLSHNSSLVTSTYITHGLPIVETYFVHSGVTNHFIHAENHIGETKNNLNWCMYHADYFLYVSKYSSEENTSKIISNFSSLFDIPVSQYSPITRRIPIIIILIGYESSVVTTLDEKLKIPGRKIEIMNISTSESILPKIISCFNDTNPSSRNPSKTPTICSTESSIQIDGSSVKGEPLMFSDNIFSQTLKIFQVSKKIGILDFRFCVFSTEQWISLLKCIESALFNGELTHLQFSGCPLGDDRALRLLNLINDERSKGSLSTLILSGAGLSKAVVDCLIEILICRNCPIKALDLSENEINDDGAKLLLQGIACNNTIKFLRLRNIGMGSSSCQAIVEVLQRNVTLETLHISHNPLGTWALFAMSYAFVNSSNHKLCTFSYPFTQIRQNQHEIIQNRLAYNRALQNQRKQKKIRDFILFPSREQYHAFCFSIENFSAGKLKQKYQISRLVLNSLELESIPSHLTKKNFPHLKELILSNNNLKEYILDEALANELIILDLSYNRLGEIPKSLKSHKSLQSLSLCRNEISEGRGIRYLLELENLRVVNLSGNWINSFPLVDLDGFFKLEQFIIHHNRMHPTKEIIYSTFFLKKSNIDLSNQELSSLPNDFAYLKDLRLANLSRNKFELAPIQLRHLPDIQQILMKGNCFESLEDLFIGHNYKARILVNKNEFQQTDKAKLLTKVRTRLLRQSLFKEEEGTDISDQLATIQPKNQSATKIVKILHVGDKNPIVEYAFSKFQKLPLVHSYTSASFVETLVGKCQCKSKHISFNHISFEHTNLPSTKLEMWNFCEDYAMHLNFFHTNSAIYVLYFDINKNLESQMIHPLQVIHTTCENPFVVLVGYSTKKTTEQEPLENQIQSLQQKGFRSIQFVLTLNQTEEQLSLLLQYLVKLIESESRLISNANMQDRELLQLLESENNFTQPPVISYSDLQVMARTCSIENDEPKYIVRYLNDIGQLLYIDDHRLGLTNVILLNREWIINAVRELFTTPLSDGVLILNNANTVWKAPCFPPFLVKVVIALLLKHEIATKLILPGQDRLLLFPSRFSASKPVLYDIWPPLQEYLLDDIYFDHPQPEIGRICCFEEAAPHDFISRLIIRLFHIANPLRYWKMGILVEKQGHKCLIEQVNTHDITFLFRAAEPSQQKSVLAPFIRFIMETSKQLAILYRTPHEFLVYYICPSAGPQCKFKFPEQQIFQNLVEGKTILSGAEEGEPIEFDNIAPDILLTDYDSSLIDVNEIKYGEAVGQGSYGTVYKGTYRDRVIAIKEMTITDSEAMEAFGREVWMSASLKHPTIAELIGFSWKPLCIILEFIPYGDLRNFIEQNSMILDWPLRLKMALDIATAMEYLHNRDPVIIHRDLKTPNCLIAGLDINNVTVKVTDLGESVLLAQSYTGRDNLQNPVWMAPEILRNEAYDQQSDVYSYAIILWELLTRDFPFNEYPVASSPFKSQLEDAIIDGLRPSIPSECATPFKNLVEQCWANEPDDRPRFTEIVKSLEIMIVDSSSWNSFPRGPIPQPKEE